MAQKKTEKENQKNQVAVSFKKTLSVIIEHILLLWMHLNYQ